MLIHTIILGIVEGLTEFIPVSSTAHLLLTGHLLGMPHDQFLEALSICIQSGAIAAVIYYFWQLIWRHTALIPKIIAGFIPTAIVGLLLYPFIKNIFDNITVIGVALIVGGVGLLLIKPVDEQATVTDLTYKQAIWLGIAQIASFIPGVSRAGATLIGGTLMRIPRATIVTFSFLLAIPTILGASVVEFTHIEGLFGAQWALIGVGTLVAFVTALLTIKWFMTVLTKKPLAWFGWYRITIGILVLIFLQ